MRYGLSWVVVALAGCAMSTHPPGRPSDDTCLVALDCGPEHGSEDESEDESDRSHEVTGRGRDTPAAEPEVWDASEPELDPEPDPDGPELSRTLLSHLPTAGPTGWWPHELAVGPDGDLWLMGERPPWVWLDRLAPDGHSRWNDPWFGDRPTHGPLESRARLVLDREGRATVAGSHVQYVASGEPMFTVWLARVSAAGSTRWMGSESSPELAGLMPLSDGGVYLALRDPYDGSTESTVSIVRYLADGTSDVSTRLGTRNLEPPVIMVPAGPDLDETVYLAGGTRQIFGTGRVDAFMARFDLGEGTSTWPEPPPATGVRDYTSVLAAKADTEGGLVAVVATALHRAPASRPTESGMGPRDVRRMAADGALLWSTPIRTQDGSDRNEGYADYRTHMAVDAAGHIYVAYTISTDPLEVPPADGGSDARIVLEELDPEGAFVWAEPFVIEHEHAALLTGLALDGQDRLYLITRPADWDSDAGNWLIHLDPSAIE